MTPVYNGEEHIEECIESVLAQTYQHWDYTIVNNCSTDRTLEVAQPHARRDPRIRIHSNETFVRAIANHNIAVRQISPTAEYCKIVAADDWLFPDCLEKMVRMAERSPRIAVVSAYHLYGSKVMHNEAIPYSSPVVTGREACRRKLLGASHLFDAPTTVLYRADVVRSRPSFYNESNIHADAETNFVILEDRDFAFVHQVLSFRRSRPRSLTSLSEKLSTYLPSRLHELTAYGPRYLTEEELARRLRSCQHAYYHFLASQLFRRRGRQFWEFHRGKLAEAGHPLSRSRLGTYAAAYALDLLLNPKATSERALRKLRRRLRPGPARPE